MSATSWSTSSLLDEELRAVLGLGLLLLLRLLDAHQVEVPAGELRGEAHVLAVAPDRDREVLLVDDDVHAVLLLVDDDRADLGRRERIDDELRRIGRPQDDVDALAGELVGHRRHARAAHADAGADRIEARVVRLDGDLRAHAGIARRGLDLEHAFLDLRHFELEQLHDEFGRDARQDELRARGGAVDAHQVGAHAIADAKVLLRDQLVARDHRLRCGRIR